jgi:hypothetical protein
MTTTKAEMARWKAQDSEDRRTRLDALGAIENKTDDEWVEHDVLATLVAIDEKEANDAETKPEENTEAETS